MKSKKEQRPLGFPWGLRRETGSLLNKRPQPILNHRSPPGKLKCTRERPWNAIYAAGDVQVINMTHEGQAVAAAAGYTMASRKLGFFFGSHVGIFNALSNIYCAAGVRGELQQNVASGASANRPAESDAKNIFERKCQQCHDLATASTKQPSEDWASVIARMAGYGAPINSADQRKLIDYLNSSRK